MQDATVQSIPQMSQVPTSVAPSSYVAVPAQQAPAQAYQGPVNYQVGTSYPQVVPQAGINYQSSPTQYAPQSQPAPQGNPWESAFNRVVGLLSAPVQSPFQGQPSAQTQAYAPANYGQTPYGQPTPNLGTQTSYPNQDYSTNYSQTSSSPSLAEVADYLDLSNPTRQVIDAFGVEAPAILNNYALQVEGMLDSAVAWGNQAQGLLQGYANFAVNEHQENLAYNEILTNPDVLSDYTLKFFGPEGPYPVYESEADLETPGYRTEQVVPGYGNFPAPPAASAPQQPQNFWGGFNEMMAHDPQNAWRVLNQAQPQTVANKLFVME